MHAPCLRPLRFFRFLSLCSLLLLSIFCHSVDALPPSLRTKGEIFQGGFALVAENPAKLLPRRAWSVGDIKWLLLLLPVQISGFESRELEDREENEENIIEQRARRKRPALGSQPKEAKDNQKQATGGNGGRCPPIGTRRRLGDPTTAYERGECMFLLEKTATRLRDTFAAKKQKFNDRKAEWDKIPKTVVRMKHSQEVERRYHAAHIDLLTHRNTKYMFRSMLRNAVRPPLPFETSQAQEYKTTQPRTRRPSPQPLRQKGPLTRQLARQLQQQAANPPSKKAKKGKQEPGDRLERRSGRSGRKRPDPSVPSKESKGTQKTLSESPQTPKGSRLLTGAGSGAAEQRSKRIDLLGLVGKGLRASSSEKAKTAESLRRKAAQKDWQQHGEKGWDQHVDTHRRYFDAKRDWAENHRSKDDYSAFLRDVVRQGNRPPSSVASPPSKNSLPLSSPLKRQRTESQTQTQMQTPQKKKPKQATPLVGGSPESALSVMGPPQIPNARQGQGQGVPAGGSPGSALSRSSQQQLAPSGHIHGSPGGRAWKKPKTTGKR